LRFGVVHSARTRLLETPGRCGPRDGGHVDRARRVQGKPPPMAGAAGCTCRFRFGAQRQRNYPRDDGLRIIDEPKQPPG